MPGSYPPPLAVPIHATLVLSHLFDVYVVISLVWCLRAECGNKWAPKDTLVVRRSCAKGCPDVLKVMLSFSPP